jgi:hypothetical protein
VTDQSPRRYSAAAERNAGPILDVLRSVLPSRGVALEIASGTGQHAAHFAAALPGWVWQPTEVDTQALPSIASWCAGIENVRAPLVLDVMAPTWPVAEPVDAIFCANLLHISPWSTCGALMRSAARYLAPAGVLVTYGAYLEDSRPTAPSNLAFDADLRSRDPAWGLRRLADVAEQAHRAGLTLCHRFEMPANNLTLVFGRTTAKGFDSRRDQAASS